jgi:hypothetical protein
MSGAWDPFMRPGPMAAITTRLPPERDSEREATRQLFGGGAGAAWLRARIQREESQPSYLPGVSFDQVAYAEGRKAMLREILNDTTTPAPAGDL